MKKILATLLFSVNTAIGFAQSASESSAPQSNNEAATPATKCLPSGASITGGDVSADGLYVRLANLAKFVKIFDVRSLQLVAANKEYSDEANASYNKYFSRPTVAVNYKLEIINGQGGGYFPPKTFQIKNAKGAVVASYQTEGQVFYYFEPIDGSLFVEIGGANKYKSMLIRPGKNEKLICKNDFVFANTIVRSPDGRYLITDKRQIIDLKTDRMKEYISRSAGETHSVFFATPGGSDEFFWVDSRNGIMVYSCETGKQLRTIPVPADLPRDEGYQIAPAPNGKDFLYYLLVRNYAPGSAYWVHDGKGTTFCDPEWQAEQKSFYAKKLIELNDIEERKKVAAAEAARKRAEDDAQLARNLATQAEYRRQHPSGASYNATPASTDNKCSACNGTGWIMQTNTAYTKTTREYSSGAGSGSTNYRVTSTPVMSNYAQRTICSACRGSGKSR